MAKRLAFEIESAKTCLLNPATKAAYDAALHGREGAPSGPQPSRPAEASASVCRPVACPASSKPRAAVIPGLAGKFSAKERTGKDPSKPADSPHQQPFDPYYKWLAIPPKEQPPDYYRLLGLSVFEPDLDVIANAVDARMAHIRTFQTGKHSEVSQRILNEIAQAKVCLLKPQRKSEYDRRLRVTSHEAEPAIQPPVSVPSPFAPAAAIPTVQMPPGLCGLHLPPTGSSATERRNRCRGFSGSGWRGPPPLPWR